MVMPRRPRTVASQFVSALMRVSDPQSAFELAGILFARISNPEPGGFNYMPARMVHEAWTTAGSVVFITVDGPWDVNWVQGPPTSADVIQ
jgi:hypothetical protein